MDEVLFLVMYREYFDGNVRGKPSALLAKVETSIDEKKVEAKVRQRILAQLAEASQVPPQQLAESQVPSQVEASPQQVVDMETGSFLEN
jgi:hypothetical protein